MLMKTGPLISLLTHTFINQVVNAELYQDSNPQTRPFSAVPGIGVTVSFDIVSYVGRVLELVGKCESYKEDITLKGVTMDAASWGIPSSPTAKFENPEQLKYFAFSPKDLKQYSQSEVFNNQLANWEKSFSDADLAESTFYLQQTKIIGFNVHSLLRNSDDNMEVLQSYFPHIDFSDGEYYYFDTEYLGKEKRNAKSGYSTRYGV
eukprot:Pgem_evm1s7035